MMQDRYYRVVVASTQGGLYNAAPAGEGWTVLENTIRHFVEMDANDDSSLGNIGRLLVKQDGWVALAYMVA